MDNCFRDVPVLDAALSCVIVKLLVAVSEEASGLSRRADFFMSLCLGRLLNGTVSVIYHLFTRVTLLPILLMKVNRCTPRRRVTFSAGNWFVHSMPCGQVVL